MFFFWSFFDFFFTFFFALTSFSKIEKKLKKSKRSRASRSSTLWVPSPRSSAEPTGAFPTPRRKSAGACCSPKTKRTMTTKKKESFHSPPLPTLVIPVPALLLLTPQSRASGRSRPSSWRGRRPSTTSPRRSRRGSRGAPPRRGERELRRRRGSEGRERGRRGREETARRKGKEAATAA